MKLETEAVKSDIKLYVETTLAKWPLSSKLYDEVLSSLIDGANGQFRWVDCQICSLQALKMPKAIQKALARLPKDLDAIYSETLQKIDDINYDSVHHIFMWLLYAYEPLTLDELADILAIDVEEEKFDPQYRPLELQHGLHSIVDSTFVVIDSRRGENVVQFAHISVQEFLVSKHSWAKAKNLFRLNKELGHEIIAQSCIIYLLQFDSWEMPRFE
ncbi:hypothetical protein GYMLUDRAFT_594405, partial [Collybiopsis luxurians FD-317 M1]